jgi:hypothetical protein
MNVWERGGEDISRRILHILQQATGLLLMSKKYHNIQHTNLQILSGFGCYAITSYVTSSW